MAVHWLQPARRLARATLVAYSQILFSGRPLAGLLFLAASFCADPFVGLVGLTAALAANITALNVWHDRIRWELGLAGYNAVMLGLAVGHYLPHGRLVFLLAVIGGVLSALASEWLGRRLSRFSLPALGLPFLSFGWIVIAFAGSGHPPAHWFSVDPLARYLPAFVAETVRVFGSAFFSASVLSGLLVLAGLLVASRLSAVVGLGGALIAALLAVLRMPELDINLVIVPIGLVFFIAPSRRLFWQVPAGILLTVVLAVAFDRVAQVTHLPYLILPLTATLFAALLLGRTRSLGVELVPTAMLRSPEDHIRIFLQRVRPRLVLPFFGTWFVSQGVDGGETHKDRLAIAWDFMVRDERGRTFTTPGYRLSDYHAYGLQVVAPAAGRVVAVENGVWDNAPGKTNKEQNWGNHVIIEHTFLEFSILAHLGPGSVRVRVGDEVAAGTVLGTCGNSGYSAQPHIHYQLQAAPVPGADALPADFNDYLVLESSRERFVRRGRPKQDQTVQPLLPQENMRSLVSSLGVGAQFAVDGRTETWRADADAAGNVILSGATRVRLKVERAGLAATVKGARKTLLARALEGLDFIPFYYRPGLEFGAGRWRHKFGRNETVPGFGDALVLESASAGVTRRLWLVRGAGIVRVERHDRNRKTDASRQEMAGT